MHALHIPPLIGEEIVCDICQVHFDCGAIECGQCVHCETIYCFGICNLQHSRVFAEYLAYSGWFFTIKILASVSLEELTLGSFFMAVLEDIFPCLFCAALLRTVLVEFVGMCVIVHVQLIFQLYIRG